VDIFLWGSTWVAIKLGLETLGPFTSAAARFILGFALLALVFRIWRFRFPDIKNIRRDVFLTGLVMYGLTFSLLYWAQQHLNASTAAVLFSSMPFFVAVCAHFMLAAERLNLRVIIGMVIGLAGTIVLFSRDLDFSGPAPAMLAVLTASFAASWASVKIKRDLGMIRSTVLATLQLPPGLFVMVLGVLLFEMPPEFPVNAKSVGSVVYLAVAGTGGAFIGWYWILKRIPATAASLMTFLEPVVATILSIIVLSESLSSRFLGGAVLILAGVLLVVTRRGPGKIPADRPLPTTEK
jgi:drug/metabolite transporter (DMT)-like permease